MTDLELVRVLVAGDQVVAVDVQGEVLAWSLESERRTLTPADAIRQPVVSAKWLGIESDGNTGIISRE